MSSQPKTRQAKVMIPRLMPKDELLARYAEGQTLVQILAEIERTSGQKYSHYFLQKTLQSFGADFDEARRCKAAYHADRISMVTDLAEAGQLDAGTARIASDNHKWLASKSDPQAYGERSSVDVNVFDLGKAHLAALRERMKSFRATVVPQVAALQHLGALPAPKIAQTASKTAELAPETPLEPVKRKRGRPKKRPSARMPAEWTESAQYAQSGHRD